MPVAASVAPMTAAWIEALRAAPPSERWRLGVDSGRVKRMRILRRKGSMWRASSPTPNVGQLREASVSGPLRLDEVRVSKRLLATCLLLAVCVPSGTQAQLVRGTVREAESGAPLAGVVVSIQRPARGRPAPSLVATLTDARGEYAISPNDTGRFTLTAKRIGARQFQSPAFTLARGQTHALDVMLDPVRFDLPTVTVSGVTPCRARAEDRGRIAALWEEARTAIAASELSLRDRLFRATMTRYQRELEPRRLATRSETQDVRRGVTEHAFVSVPAESLAAHGYARVLPDQIVEYFAPDERVLLSELFVRDHCFGLARDGADGEVGITFEPTRNRRVSDIQGTIWLDARSYELRRVTFSYTNFPSPVRDPRIGGEVRFAKLASGAWHVSRWFMRVPRVELQRETTGTPSTGRVVIDRPVITGFTEDGGTAVSDDAADSRRLASLSGRVVDSTGTAPLRGARLSLSGLPQSSESRGDGSFRLDGIPVGSYTLLVDHPDYARLGLIAGEQLLTIEEPQQSLTLVQALGTRQVLRQLCGFEESPDSTTAVRFVVPPEPDAPPRRVIHLSWPSRFDLGGGLVRTRTLATDLPVDAAGGVTMCELPRATRLHVEEREAGGALRRSWDLASPGAGFAVVELKE